MQFVEACLLDISISQHREKGKKYEALGGTLHLQNGEARHLAKIEYFEVNI